MRLLIWLLIGYVVYMIVRGMYQKKIAPEEPRDTATETHKDPVCGVYVTKEDAVVGNLEGERIYFCSMKCLEKFRDQLTHTNS
jgi:YHS domain-containing protein